MADIVSVEKRSRMMSGIRSVNTIPEKTLRSALHKVGFRFRLHVKLPGKPDIVLPKYNAAIFVNGCFWHMHNCHLFKMPSSRIEFWQRKLKRNRENDLRSVSNLLDQGWRVGIVWECTLKGKSRLPLEVVVRKCSNWLLSKSKYLEVADESVYTKGV